jgi:hypothetical protein
MTKRKNELPVIKPVIDLDRISSKHDDISKQITSPLYVQKREGPGGRTLDYVDEGYMRQILNTHFPLWSWEIVKYEFLGKESIAVHGRLTILDNGIPRTFDALAAHRIACLKSNGNFVDLGNDMKSANTEAFKVACNRLCNIADDVYRKSILSEEQVDTLEGVLGLLDGQTRRKVKESVGNNSINPSNFDSTMEKLNKIMNNEKESE